MKRDYYVTPKPSALMKLLWKAAGADRYLLEKSSYSDQIKYMCLGGIIVATGVMAAIAGGYAFYTIFSPRGGALDSYIKENIVLARGQSVDTYRELVTHWPTAGLACIFGVIWGLIIFNIDRFIVTSTGKGDGTEKITWDEFKGAIPRIVMGIIIALTISKPVEIRMFKSEIDAELDKQQLKERQTMQDSIAAQSKTKVIVWSNDKNQLDHEIKKEKNKFDSLQKVSGSQANGLLGPAGLGDKYRADTARENDAKRNWIAIKTQNEPKISDLAKKINGQELADSLELEKHNKEIIMSGGLLKRISISHDLSPIISFFITLLFLAIELTPIFFKLMLIKSPYDYIEENVKELMKAEQGIYIEHDYFKDKEGVERDLVIHIEKEKIISEKKEIMDAQKRLTAYAISKYEEQMRKKIDENPSDFIKVEENPKS